MKAEELLKDCRPLIIRICLIILIFTTISDGIGEVIDSWIILIVLAILLTTIEHGYIVTSLKVVKDKKDELSEKDAIVGLTRYKQIFPTYLTIILSRGCIMAAFMILVFSVYMIAGIAFYDAGTVLNLLDKNPIDALIYCVTNNPSSVFFMTFFVIGMFVLLIVINGYFFAAPYLLEDCQLTNGSAVSQSVKMMKGHVFDYVKLLFSFFGWMLLVVSIETCLSSLLSFVPLINTLATLIAEMIGIYIYFPKFMISQALLYEQIKQEYKNHLIENQNV